MQKKYTQHPFQKVNSTSISDENSQPTKKKTNFFNLRKGIYKKLQLMSYLVVKKTEFFSQRMRDKARISISPRLSTLY